MNFKRVKEKKRMDHKYRQDSGIFVHISSVYRVDKPDPRYGNGQFKVTTATGTFPTVDRIIPDVITLPNLFPNINQYRNKYNIIDTEDNRLTKEVPIGNWTLTEYCQLLSANSGVLQFDDFTENQVTKVRIRWIGVDDDASVGIYAPAEWWNLIGFTPEHPDLKPYTLLPDDPSVYDPNVPLYVLYINDASGSGFVSDSQTNMGGESVIFITMDHMGKNAGMEANSGNPTNAVACIPNPGAQGGRIVLDNQNGTLPAINFRKPMNINSNIISVKDAAGRTLYIPPTHHVHLNMKAVKMAGTAGTFF